MSNETEHYPDTPGPPREVSEDAAAGERSMTADKWAGEVLDTMPQGALNKLSIPEAHKTRDAIAAVVSQAHTAGKAEGADFIQRVAQLDPEHCGTDPEDDAQALRGLILIAREIAASKRSEAPDE